MSFGIYMTGTPDAIRAVCEVTESTPNETPHATATKNYIKALLEGAPDDVIVSVESGGYHDYTSSHVSATVDVRFRLVRPVLQKFSTPLAIETAAPKAPALETPAGQTSPGAPNAPVLQTLAGQTSPSITSDSNANANLPLQGWTATPTLSPSNGEQTAPTSDKTETIP